MVTGESIMDVPFEWGSTVRVLSDPDNRLASVCGFRQVETSSTAAEFGDVIGAYLERVKKAAVSLIGAPSAVFSVAQVDEP